jgi:tRNA nucleotidyltransferase (CCA-adding enzyme)
LSSAPARGIELLHETGLLKYIIPEIEVGYDVTQSHHHYYGPYNTVYKHLVASLEKCPSEKLEVRLAALLHDIGKPKTKRGEGENATFYNHEYAGAKIVESIMTRLRFSKKVIDKTVLLVRNHMFYYNVDEVGESGVRRVIRKVGLENIGDLIDVRIADRLGSGVPKAVPYKLRHFKFMVEKVSHDAISVKQLKINGSDLMNELKLSPGPKIGAILDVLLSEAIEKPSLNEKKKLLFIAKELQTKNIEEIREMAKKKIAEEKKEEEKLMKKKYWVE